jgi:hypothetical protein
MQEADCLVAASIRATPSAWRFVDADGFTMDALGQDWTVAA